MTLFFLLALVLLAQCYLLPMKSSRGQRLESRVFTPGQPFGGGAGFSVEIDVGQSTVQLQLDTGSADLLVYSAYCTSCSGPHYVPDLNEVVNCTADLADVTDGAESCELCVPPFCTCSECSCESCQQGFCDGSGDSCNGATCYGDGSGLIWEPFLEYISIGDLPDTPARIGAIHNTYGQNNGGGGCSGNISGDPGFDDTVSGIWGVSLPAISVLQVMALDQLIDANDLANVIGFCIGEDDSFFSVGEDYANDPRFDFVDLASTAEYRFTVEDMRLDGGEVFAERDDFTDPCLADSGTTLYVLPTDVLAGMFQALFDLCGDLDLVGICGETLETSILLENEFTLTDDQLESYPEWIVDAAGVEISLTNYIVNVGGNAYVGIFTDGGEECILGEFLFRSYVVSMDRENMRIGFGDLSACGTEADSRGGSSPAAVLPSSF